jgi:hypothetical protein
MDKKAMLKQAAHVLREQQAEIKDLHEKIARDQKAEMIVQKLIENDELLADDVLRKLSELRTKPIQELEIMEKAAELFHNKFASFGTISEREEAYDSNPLLQYLFSDV